MKPSTLPAVVASLVTIALPVAALTAVEQPSGTPVPLDAVVQGCFASSGELNFESVEAYNSRGQCGVTICQKLGKNVAATTEGRKCYCGDKYPPKNTISDDKNCNISCTGFGQDACGGVGFWTVYNTGLELYNIPFSPDVAGSSPSAVTTSAGGETIVVTQTSSADAGKSGANAGAIAGGVVVGVVAIGAIVGGFFFYLRRRRNQEIEEEHRRNAVINNFVNGGKPPSSSGAWSNSDSRLDPVMAQRRMSDGSIADNQDYSRKILRVTNA